jgi:tRNA threonylcarbamoyladenosine biosynthesis protein TsaE
MRDKSDEMGGLIVAVHDEVETAAFAQSLAAALPANIVIALIGPLGAGKTRLVQAVAQAAGVAAGVVSSPTFVLVHEYVGRVPIYHFDAYRLRDPGEFAMLGAEEYFAQSGWSFIEWANRVAQFLPSDRLEIVIAPTGPTSRQFRLRATGPGAQQIINRMDCTLGGKSNS